MKLTIEEKAKTAVDVMVESGLDCGAMQHKKIEAIVVELLKRHEIEVRAEFVNSADWS